MQTPEEMNALANKAKNDPNALLLLWQGCSRYAYKVTTIYQQAAALNGAVDMDDLKQCAFLGFYEAVQGFDLLRGDFLPLLSYGVRRACREALGLRGRKREEHYSTVSMETPINEDLTIADTLEDESASIPFEQAEMRQDIEKALQRLAYDMRTIIRMHDIEGLSLNEIAKELGYTKELVSKRRRGAFRRLRANSTIQQYRPIKFRHKTLARFRIDHSSVVEDAVIRRLDGYENA
jgi:RNA polymerase sigma factor (sigma-70 family)